MTNVCKETIATIERELETAKNPKEFTKRVKEKARTFFILKDKRNLKWGAYFCIDCGDYIEVWFDAFLSQATVVQYGEKVTMRFSVDISNAIDSAI